MARAFYGLTSALADLSDRMARACTHVFHRRACTFADALDSMTCAFDSGSGTRTDVLYRRARSRSYVFDSLARALYCRAGTGAYVSYSRSRALADLANCVARSLSYVCYR